MENMTELRALQGRAHAIAKGVVNEWMNELDALVTDDPDEEAAIRAILDAVGDMTVALLRPRTSEC